LETTGGSRMGPWPVTRPWGPKLAAVLGSRDALRAARTAPDSL
jgi:hypothetical protein